MNRTLISSNRDSSKLLPFEKWPDEDEQEYAAFLGYCRDANGLMPSEFLQKVHQEDLIPNAILRGWMQRKDAYLKWADSQRREKVLSLLERYLEQVKTRLPSMIEREEKMRQLEVTMLEGRDTIPTVDGAKKKSSKPKPPALLQDYSKALRETNEQIGVLLRIVKALEPDSGINIQNIVSTLGVVPASKAEDIQRMWGDPDQLSDPATDERRRQ